MEKEFVLNENNEIVYTPDEETAGEEKDLYGQPVDEIFDSGDSATDEVEASADDSETVEKDSLYPPADTYTVDSPLPVALSDELTEALLADSPAGGALGSSTLTYFDRIVSGLPNGYKYVAYRTDNSDNYDGVLIYGRNYDFDGSHITFGKDSVAVTVNRTSGSNSNTTYTVEDANGYLCTPVQNGNIVYYTNVREGLPVLGGYKPPLDLSALIVVGLLSAMASAILSRLLRR